MWVSANRLINKNSLCDKDVYNTTDLNRLLVQKPPCKEIHEHNKKLSVIRKGVLYSSLSERGDQVNFQNYLHFNQI